MILYAGPVVLSSLLQSAYSITDLIVAGWFIGKDGISAINNASIIMNMLTQLAIGLTVGGNVLVGQYFGSGDHENRRKSAGNMLTVGLIAGAIATVVVCLGATMQLTVVWDTADVLMGLMALINVPVIVLLLKPALRCLDDYIQQKKSGKNPEFKASSIGLKEKVDFWN